MGRNVSELGLPRLDASGTRLAVAVTPTLDTLAYASGDSLHTAVLAFPSAVAMAGGHGVVRKMVVVDASAQTAAFELWLFSDSVTPAAANAAHSISDADAAKCVGVIPSGTYYASALNSVNVAPNLYLPFMCVATTLYGILVTRGAPTYLVGSLQLTLSIEQDT